MTQEEYTKTQFCIHVPCLIKNPSESKIITEDKFFENTYSRKIIPAKYSEEANAQKEILAKSEMFRFAEIIFPQTYFFQASFSFTRLRLNH